MKNITNYINMAINFSILGLLIYLTIVIMDIKKSLKNRLSSSYTNQLFCVVQNSNYIFV